MNPYDFLYINGEQVMLAERRKVREMFNIILKYFDCKKEIIIEKSWLWSKMDGDIKETCKHFENKIKLYEEIIADLKAKLKEQEELLDCVETGKGE